MDEMSELQKQILFAQMNKKYEKSSNENRELEFLKTCNDGIKACLNAFFDDDDKALGSLLGGLLCSIMNRISEIEKS